MVMWTCFPHPKIAFHLHGDKAPVVLETKVRVWEQSGQTGHRSDVTGAEARRSGCLFSLALPIVYTVI